jgi:hypothetical protein
MALSHSPRIVTDGLVLCLDAGNTKSYSSSSTLTDNWSWTLRTAGFGISDIDALTYANNTYVACSDSVGGILNTSTDAIVWTLRTSGFPLGIIKLTFGNNIYLAGGGGGRLNTSTNTIHWTLRTASFGSSDISALVYENNTYIAGGFSRLATSTDTIAWTLRTSGFTSNIRTFTFANNTYVAGGNQGILNTSTDAITWQLKTSGVGNNVIWSLTYGNNFYVAGGANGILTTSTDAITWQLRTSGFGVVINALTYGNNTYVAGGANGILNTSTDAITWTLRTSNTTQSINALVYSSVNGDVLYGASAGVLGDLTIAIIPTTWTDRSLSKNNATLSNIPTYSSTDGGYLSFDSASSQYATASNPGSLTRWTAEAMVRFTSSYGTKVAMVVGGQYDGVSNLNFTLGTNNAPTNYNIAVGFFNGAWRSTTGINYALNTWHHIVGTYDGSTIRQYTNGVEVDSLVYSGTPASGGEIRINRRWDDVVSSSNLFDSNIAEVKVYNRALTAAEVSQNFNALRGRFGI